MVPFAGYHMPLQYEGIIAEHEWTRTRASFFDVSHMGQFVLSTESGNGEKALERLLPVDASSMQPGQLRYSLLLADDGGILDDLLIARLPEGSMFDASFYMVVNGATKRSDFEHIFNRLRPDIWTSELRETAMFALQGPDSAPALERVIPGVSALSFMQGAHFEWPEERYPVWVSRTGYTGEDGFELSVTQDYAEALANALCAQSEVRPAGLGARDSLRLEAGLPLYGHDLSTQTDPVSTGLAFAIPRSRRTGGGFPGAHNILPLLRDGAPKARVGLSLDGRLPAREGAQVFAENQNIGVVTSGGFSPTLGHPIAMALINSGHSTPGTQLTIDVRGRPIPARITTLPFVPHRYHRKGAKQ